MLAMSWAPFLCLGIAIELAECKNKLIFNWFKYTSEEIVFPGDEKFLQSNMGLFQEGGLKRGCHSGGWPS